MRKRFGAWASLMAITLILGIPSIGRPGGEEPPNTDIGEHLVGPALIGTLTLQEGQNQNITFTGWSCKGKVGGTLTTGGLVNIVALQADDLLDRRAEWVSDVNALVPGCYPERGTPAQLIVNTVLSFSKNTNNTQAVAQVVLMAIAFRP